MKKALNIMAALVLGGAMVAVPASAGVVLTFDGTPTNNTYDNIPTFPYLISINGGTPVDMMCDDVLTEITPGESWNANAYSLTAANLPDFKFGADGLTDYEEAAWIETGVVKGTIASGDGNAAVWSIFDPSFNTTIDHSAINAILNNAANAVAAGNLNYSGITIYTPNPFNSAQEMIFGTVTPNCPKAPEPATSAMLGGGLLALGFLGRRLRQRS